MWLIPDTLVGRTVAILLLGLGVFHLGSIWVYQVGVERLLGRTREHQLAERLVSAKRAIAEVPASERERAAHALSTGSLEIHWSSLHAIGELAAEDEPLRALRERLQKLVPELAGDRLRLAYADEGFGLKEVPEATRHMLLASVQLADGTWVNARAALFAYGGVNEHGVLASLTAMGLGILFVAFFLVRSMTAPLRALAGAAERLGIDVSADPLPVAGPREVRRATQAFNDMQARIRRLVSDRTHTLAAVSHDLKTPITRLRLRAEFVRDEELRPMIDADLDEMEAMLDTTLAFLRSDAMQEETKTVDVASILETLCNHWADLGRDVALAGTRHAVIRCKPLAIKRALANLIENAVKYGERARVTIADGSRDLVVTVEDEGPGIPEEERERVFDPFYRIETSRNRETGGTGLGLTVVRTLVHAHGGEITLENPEPLGLRVTVSLPKAGAS